MLKKISVSLLLFLVTIQLYAQYERDETANIFNFKGLQYKNPDSSFYINFRFRMQSRLGLQTAGGDDFSIDEVEARIRRLRARFDGYILSPKIGYSIQLSFSRSDQDIDNTGIANIIRDAVVYYHFNEHFYMAFGLNKLPGNRQRVNSSSELQFADRSIVNAAMTVDRDFGVKAYYTNEIGKAVYHLKGAISTGEGRVANSTDNGLAYTIRGELLPFGAFKNGGDYFEGDLEREERLKISVGGGYSFNAKTTRTGGQTGMFLYAPVDLGTTMLDALFKYNGWAYAVEYLRRTADDPITENAEGDLRYAFAGQGLNQQLSYVFPSKWEIAGRYSWLQPDESITSLEDQTDIVELGVTKYIVKHRLKVQLNTNYRVREGDYRWGNDGNRWGGLFQIELGI